MNAVPVEPYMDAWPMAETTDLVVHEDKTTGNPHYFYPDESLVAVGYVTEEFALVRIGDRLFELQGRIGRESERPVGGYWWVQVVDIP